MAPVRLRHPKGVSTLQIDFEKFTVLDLQQEIYAVTEIPPSLQDLKAGYPPQSLTLIPELPLESLGLKQGDQLIVNQKQSITGTNSPARPQAASPPQSIPPPRNVTPGSSLNTRVTPPSGKVDPGNPDFVEIDGSFLVHRIVPDDNSCLFSSIALIFEQGISKAQSIRQIVADAIRADMVTWTEAILGYPRDEYIKKILKPETWGGAIELAILANHYRTEIASIDVETGRIDYFTPDADKNSGNRCIVLYSGIHYDAVSLSPMQDAPPDFHQTITAIMSTDPATDPTLLAAGKLAAKLREKRAFTNTATFTLKCEDCKQGLKGEKEARTHAAETGHVNFGEY